MSWIDSALGIHPAALTFRSERGAVLAANIANSTTPGYRARDYDFQEALKASMKEQSAGAAGNLNVGVTGTHAKHISTASVNDYGGLLYRMPTRVSTNDNTVEADVEQAAFAENALRYQASLQFLNGSISGIRKAITGK